MTPTQFSNDAVAWMAAVTLVLGTFAVKVLPALSALWQAVGEMKDRQDRHGEQISALSGNLTQVALLTPTPPVAPSPVLPPTILPPAAPSPTLPAMAPPAGMTEAEAIAGNVTMRPVWNGEDPLPAPPSGVGAEPISQELPAGTGGQ